MKTQAPLISVVCPTYLSETFIEKTLETVINQTLRPFELVVTDDGSEDQTVAVVRRLLSQQTAFSWQILENLHQGPGATRNAGIQAASGDWIAFLDSDDLWEQNKIERVRDAIDEHPEANIFCHNETHHLLDGRRELLDMAKGYSPQIPLPKQMFRQCLFSTSAVTCRKNLLVQHGLFDKTLPSAQDYELWLRLSPHLTPHFIPETLGNYIDRPKNISSRHPLRHMRNVLRCLVKNRLCVSRLWFAYTVLRHIMAHVKTALLVH